MFQKTWDSFTEQVLIHKTETLLDPDADFCRKYGIRAVPSVLILDGESFEVLKGADLRLANLLTYI